MSVLSIGSVRVADNLRQQSDTPSVLGMGAGSVYTGGRAEFQAIAPNSTLHGIAGVGERNTTNDPIDSPLYHACERLGHVRRDRIVISRALKCSSCCASYAQRGQTSILR